MKVFYTLTMILLVGLLITSSYLLWQNYNEFGGIPFLTNGNPNYGAFSANLSFAEGNNSQFYPNMRYKNKVIGYWIEPDCEAEKVQEMRSAMIILSEKTILKFESKDKNQAEISILCSEIAPEPEEEGHFVAGEGGPSRIINTSTYSVILTGRIALYRNDKCDKPQIALHELLHALGFDHKRDENSIMYPVTSCSQTLDESIVEEINQIYSIPSEPDLLIERIGANLTGRYLNFEISVVNYGLNDMNGVKLRVLAAGEEVKVFDLGNLGVGVSKVLTVSNLKMPNDSDSISFAVEGSSKELSFLNNRVDLVLEER